MSRSKRSRRSFLKLMAGAGAAIAGSAAGVVPEVVAIGAAPRNPLNWRQLGGGELATAARDALTSKNGQRLAEYLTQKGFVLNATASQGIAVTNQGRSARIVGVTYHSADGRTAQLLHTPGDGTRPTVAAAGIVARAADGTVTLDVYQVDGTAVRAVESTQVVGRTLRVHNVVSGTHREVTVPERAAAETSGTAPKALGSVSDAYAWSCGDCERVYDILLAIGCAISSYFMCQLCGFAGWPLMLLCGVLCAIFWALLCYWGDWFTRCRFCQYVGYCRWC